MKIKTASKLFNDARRWCERGDASGVNRAQAEQGIRDLLASGWATANPAAVAIANYYLKGLKASRGTSFK